MFQQQFLRVNEPVSRPALTVADATRYVKQTQQALLNNSSQLVSNNKNSNNNINLNRVTTKKSNAFQSSSQENVSNTSNGNRLLNGRNRYHPLSSTSKPITNSGRTVPQTTTLAPVTVTNSKESSAERGVNRFVSRFGSSREQTIIRTKPLVTEQQPKRINVTHNGSANRDGGSSLEVSNRTHQLQLLQKARQKLRGSSAEAVTQPPPPPPTQAFVATKHLPEPAPVTEIEPADEVEEEGEEEEGEDVFYEDIESDTQKQNRDDVITTTKSNEENKPVILTSNFFLPGKPIPNLQNHDIENQRPNELSNDGGSEKQLKDADENVTAEKAFVVNEAKKAVQLEREKVEKPTTKPLNASPKVSTEDPNIEYEYEYEDYVDESTTVLNNSTVDPKNSESNDKQIKESKNKEETEENTTALVTEDIVETPSDEMAKTSSEQIETPQNVATAETPSTTEMKENAVDSTESYVVVASVQTSRSISGARFLTFPQVEQEEKKQALGDLEKDPKDDDDDDNTDKDDPTANDSDETDAEIIDDLLDIQNETITMPQSEETTESSKKSHHKLSSISEKLAHLHELNEPRAEITTKSLPVLIRKFTPRTTTASPRKQTTSSKKLFHQSDDELASLLPPGFKYRANDLNKSPTTTTTTTTTTENIPTSTKPQFPLNKIKFQEISIESLLPKDYKPPNIDDTVESLTSTPDISKISPKIEFDESLAALLPKDYKLSDASASLSTTIAPLRISTITEDVNKFLPPGYKLSKYSTTTKRTVLKTTMDDIGKFLPPGYKLPKTTTKNPTTSEELDSKDIENSGDLLNKIKFSADISSLLPPGFAANNSVEESSSEQKPLQTSTESSSNYKIVFPKRLSNLGGGGRPGMRKTTPRPGHIEGPQHPGITIRKGLPQR